MVSAPYSPNDLDEILPLIAPHIDRLHREFGGYSVEATERLLREGIATLHLVGDEAFFIAQWEPATCHILSASAVNGHLRDWPSIISDASNYVKQYGCSKITFTSPRKGWGRVVTKMGFHVETVTYAMEV